MPGPGHAHLSGAVFSSVRHNGMQVLRGLDSSIELPKVFVLIRSNPALYPNRIDAVALPVGKQTHAIPGRHDGLEMLLQLLHGQAQKNMLAYSIRRFNLQCNFGNNTQCSEANNSSI